MTNALNDPKAPGYAIRPRLRVMSNGVEIPRAMVCSVTSNTNFSADRFSISFAQTTKDVGTFKWWSQQRSLPVDIQLGLLPLGAAPDATPSWQSLTTGEADKITIEMDRNAIHVEGRDLTANLIDKKNTKEYVNQSSSDVIQSIAAAHGLTAKVASTTGTEGRFWTGGRETSTLNASSRITTEWDLVVALAKKEGFDAYVQGSTLYFQPMADPSSTPYIWLHHVNKQGHHIGNVQELRMDRALAAAKGMTVKVKSWNSKQARAIEKVSSLKTSIGSSGKSQSTEYILQKPDMTEDEAQSYADATAAEFARHEMLISARLPGDMILTPRVMVSLQGTGTDFDQIYNVLSVTKVIDVKEGFYMHASCKNKASAA